MMRIVTVALVCFSIFSCAPELTYEQRDLLEYGIPITLDAPDSVRIKTMDWGLQKDVTLENDEGYSMQIFSSLATTPNLRVALADYKEISRDNPYFSKFIQEDDDGFIFEVMPDTIPYFDFRHIKIQGDREYIFQMGLLGSFPLEQVQEMYRISREAL